MLFLCCSMPLSSCLSPSLFSFSFTLFFVSPSHSLSFPFPVPLFSHLIFLPQSIYLHSNLSRFLSSTHSLHFLAPYQYVVLAHVLSANSRIHIRFLGYAVCFSQGCLSCERSGGHGCQGCFSSDLFTSQGSGVSLVTRVREGLEDQLRAGH